jgi:hypothetical protein
MQDFKRVDGFNFASPLPKLIATGNNGSMHLMMMLKPSLSAKNCTIA